jgi:hypothetical protein
MCCRHAAAVLLLQACVHLVQRVLQHGSKLALQGFHLMLVGGRLQQQQQIHNTNFAQNVWGI